MSAFGFNERLKGAKRMERDGGGEVHIAIWPSKNNGRQICRCRFLRQSNESHKDDEPGTKEMHMENGECRFRHSKAEKKKKKVE